MNYIRSCRVGVIKTTLNKIEGRAWYNSISNSSNMEIIEIWRSLNRQFLLTQWTYEEVNVRTYSQTFSFIFDHIYVYSLMNYYSQGTCICLPLQVPPNVSIPYTPNHSLSPHQKANDSTTYSHAIAVHSVRLEIVIVGTQTFFVLSIMPTAQIIF